ncbi:thiamine-phosphate kinase [Crenobacter sp. SG2303]|uniref:Thiamine-monophosphate kinase n=1 Tax=Crenobacter oryzisoli TaxID=3056844 RepID=A0ABT7XIK4_9NEIS|nr:thiamine-phosphate kinase [Crenobacter sp. SG2303]MDN0073611.1 thiamine-phosphate kinase [Crenobacter sp. SG2303]
MNEFDLIRRYFTRSAPNAVLGVGDDAAIVRPSPGCDLHVSVDMLVEGRHFFADVDPRALGHKTLAVNLSDMAAMGAVPRWVVLSVALPTMDESWVAAFADGFFGLAERYGVAVIGGDTTRGPLTLSVTVFGETPHGQALRRDAAQVGDDIWVSGELGLAALAVRRRLKGDVEPPAEVLAAAQQRLDWPTPRVELGQALLPLARACLDVSDGLAGDLQHILERSNVGATLNFDELPTAPWLAERRRELADCIAAGGDDYELLFTADPGQHDAIAALANQLGVRLTRIGRIDAEAGLRVTDAAGQPLTLTRMGYDHFA